MGTGSSNSASIKELASRIAEQVDSGNPVKTELATSQRIIARVTDGIYREPWAAFRELIANAYDADATRVIVDTGAPDFSQVTVRDNGNGMAPEAVAYILKSIGGSSKRTAIGADYDTVSSSSVEESPGGRPLIGKIGIGLFAVAQLTQHFQIITKSRGHGVRTSATIKLRTHDEERISSEEEAEYIAGDVSITSETVRSEDLDTHGTTIILYSLRPEIRRALQSSRRWALSKSMGPDMKPVREAPEFHIGVLPGQIKELPDGVEPSLPWTDDLSPSHRFTAFLRAAADNSGRSKAPSNLDHFDDYLKLLWHLSLSLPLNYPEQHPFDLTGRSGMLFLEAPLTEKSAVDLNLVDNESLRQKLRLRAKNIDENLPFNIFVDGVELKRPITLPNELKRPSRVNSPMMLVGKVEDAFDERELERAGGQLSFEAYLYWNSKIVPKEISGALIRVREASGTLFDKSFLDYQISEQNRLSQITAEIFVHQGLDAAINIDRESFNYSHPHFLYIQKWLHRALRLLINHNKRLAKSDLERERQANRVKTERGIVDSAMKIWEAQRGEEADRPLTTEDYSSPVSEVGGVTISWPQSDIVFDGAKASAIAVILEAYGVLSQLDSDDRAALITDLLSILNDTE